MLKRRTALISKNLDIDGAYPLVQSNGTCPQWETFGFGTEPTGCRSFMIISRCTLRLTCKLNSLGYSVAAPSATEY